MKEVHKDNETLIEELSELDGSEEFSTANLPSRKEIHGKKKQKTKVKIKFPFVKMLALFFVIILGTVWAVATQITKDGDSAKSSSEKESEYEESIGEISGFDDEEEEMEKDNEEAVDKEEAAEETKEADIGAEQQESSEEEKVTEEMTVTTTETAGTSESKEQNASATTAKNGVTEHVVQSNENLFRIALKYYSSAEGVEIIKQYNGLSSNEIVVGQVLKIPPR